MLTYYLGGINLKDLLEYNFKDKDYIRYIRHKTRNRKKGQMKSCSLCNLRQKRLLTDTCRRKVNLDSENIYPINRYIV